MKNSRYFIAMGLLVLALIFVAGTSRVVNLGNNFLAGVLESSNDSSSTKGKFTLSPSSLSTEVTSDKTKFENSVVVSSPYVKGETWPTWYIKNTAPWNTIYYHYGKSLPNGWGPGKIKWTTDLTGYAPGTYTDTITLTSEKYEPVTFVQTIKVLSAGETSVIVDPAVISNPTPTTPVITPTAPVANFAVSCVKLTCSLDASASAGSSITSYKWDLGKSPGGSESGKKISTTYPSAGSRTVTLTVTNSLGSNTSSKTFTVNAEVVSTPPIVNPTSSTKFSIGKTVQTTSVLNVRATASLNGTLLGTQPSGAQGTVTAGPVNASNYNWWQVNYGTGVDGWSTEDFLIVASVPATPTTPTTPTTPPTTPTPTPTPAPSISNLPAHPRVWMNPTRITHLKAQRAANTLRWSRVLAMADGQVNRTTYNVSDLDKVPDLCLVYLATDDARYARRVGTILTNYATEANKLTGDSGYSVRFNLPLVTMGLDWCYNDLTATERQQAATWLMNRADWVWPESNPARLNAHGTNAPAGNYFWGFLMTGPAALAASGNDTGTGTLSGTDRAQFHVNLVLKRWNGQIANFFASEGVGGAWAEGTNYESAWRVGSFVDGFQTAGIPLSTPFLRASLEWRLHSTMPGFVYKIPFGDQPRVSEAPFYTYDRLQMLYSIAPSNASGTLLSQLYHWLTRIGQVPTVEFNSTAMLADELLRYDPSVVATSDLSALPKHYLAPGAGFLVYRTSWTDPNATVIAFESGPTGDHGARDANGLMIWKGGFWVSATANLFSHTGIEGSTVNYNNLTVGGVGQKLYNGNGGTITGSFFSDTLVRFGGQAKNAYGYQNQWANTRFIDDYRREVAFLPVEDVIVVVDRATSRNAADAKVWRWHSKNPAVINGNTFTLSNPAGDQRCVGKVFHPTAVLGSQAFALGPTAGGNTTSHAVTVTMSGSASDTVVTVFQCSAVGNSSLSSGSNGLTVTVGSRTVFVPTDPSLPMTVQ